MREKISANFWAGEACEYCGSGGTPSGRGSIMPEMLPEDLQQFVNYELASGHFRSTRELLVEGIRLLQRERDEAVKGIQAGLDDFQAGRFQPLDDAFGDLRKELGVRTQ